MESDQNIRQMKLQFYGNKAYFWKIQINELGPSLVNKSTLNQLISTFISSFTSIKRDSDKDLKKLSEQFLQSIKSFFININLETQDFLEYILGLHNNFHSNEIDIRRNLSIRSLEDCRRRLHFNSILQKTFSKDVKIEDRVNIYITEVIELKSFSKENFAEVFLNNFQSFILNFTTNKGDIIREAIYKVFTVYESAYNEMVLKTENELKKTLESKINAINPCKVSLLMSMLPSADEPSQWELLNELVLDNEEVKLEQVVCLGLNEVLVVCSLRYSNGLLLIISKEFITNIIKNSIEDCDTVICEGSSRNNIVYFCNKQKKAWISYEQEYRLIQRKEIQIFSLILTEVKSAVLVSQKEIALIDQSNDLVLLNLENKKVENSTSEVLKRKYEGVSLSPCTDFIILASKSEVFVFNTKFELIILEYSSPVYSLFVNGSLLCINQNENGETYTNIVEYPFQLEKNSKSEKYSERISLEYEKTLRFGKDLLSELFTPNKFVSISRGK